MTQTEASVEPNVEDAYAEHVKRLRERMAQEPQVEKYAVEVSMEALKFFASCLDALQPTTERGQELMEELQQAVLDAPKKAVYGQSNGGEHNA